MRLSNTSSSKVSVSRALGMLLLVGMSVTLASCGLDPSSQRRARPAPPAETRPLPSAQLTVHSDGCGVIRAEMAKEPQGLQWSITDSDGFEVLERNAAGETRYRYFRPGTYSAVLEAWNGNRYAPISNTVTINC